MLTDATRRQLQRLRFLLEQALSQTQDPTEVGRHSAVVLLDGACEHAMGISLGHLGKPIPREFRQKFNELQVGLPAWTADAWAAVVQLHEARNQAQHHGTVSDAAYVPAWAAQAQRFIESLVEAAFGAELRDVLVAESVETEDVRLLLVESERALDQQDAAAAFAAAVTGFDAAREAWRGQRAEAIGQLRLQATGLGHLSGIETDPTNLSLLRFEDLLEMQPFAPDIAEYHWLVARRGEVDKGIAPTPEVARRAFLFALAWVLRWEAFAARYEARRYPPPPPPYEPPVTGADHPVLHGADVELLHHIGGWLDDPTLENVRYSIKLTLADIPEYERELWAQQVGDVLNEAIAERGMELASSASVDAGGIVRLHGVTAKPTGTEIREWLSESLDEGERRYRWKIAEQQELASRLPALHEQLAEALKVVKTGDIAGAAISEEREDGSTLIGVPLQIDDAADPMLQHVLQQAVIDVLSGRSDVQYFHSTLWFQLDHDANAAAALVAAAVTAYRDQAATRASGVAAVKAHRQALEVELRQGAVLTTAEETRTP
jgi:hypothetical protein